MEKQQPVVCPNCGICNPVYAERCDCGFDFESNEMEESYDQTVTEIPPEPKAVIDVRTPDGKTEVYRDHEKLRKDILGGRLQRDSQARIKDPSSDSDAKANTEEPEWTTLEKATRGIFRLNSLYHPVWSHTKEGIFYGILVCIILKCLDTTFMLFQADPTVGIIWLVIVGSLFVGKWIKYAPFFAIIISIKFGVQLNLFMTFLAAMAVGAIFGVPLGMIGGSIVGVIRRSRIPRAPDAEEERSKPLLWGILAPGAVLVVLIPLYIWFNFLVINWLAKSA